MIIYSTETDNRYTDYGILIPIRYQKAKKVYDTLQQGLMKDLPTDAWVTEPSNIPIDRETLLLCHTARYVDSFLGDGAEKEIVRTYELVNEDGTFNRYAPETAKSPLKNLVKQNLLNAAACCETAEIALKTGFAYFLGGGSHHAMADYGSGFCLINDVVLMARSVLSKKLVKKVWIVDVDAHKGDGTAFLTQDDEDIHTLSIHMKHGWPLDAPEYSDDGTYNLSWTPSDIDIGIAKGEEELYNKSLQDGLLEMDKRFSMPDIAIVVGGVDPYEKDELSSTKDLKLTKEMLLERDLLLYNFFKSNNIPQAYVSAGGYGEHSWEVYCNFLETVLKERFLK